MTTSARAGQMLASAVFHGALLDRIWWGRWLEAALRGPTLVDDLMWLDLDPLGLDDDGPLSQPRRWFADPVTRMLLAHWHAGPTRMIDQNAEECLSAFFKWRGDSSDLVDLLVGYTERHWQFRMPNVLLAHAAGKHRAVPVPANDWRRVLGCEFDPNTVISAADKPRRRRSKRKWCENQKRVLRRVSADIRKLRTRPLSAKKAAARELEKLKPLLASERLLNSWCIEALTFDRGKQQRGLMPSSVLAFLGLLTEHIIHKCDDLLGVSAEELVDRFDARLAVIEKAGRRNRTLNALRSFYRHLRRHRPDLPPFPLLLEAHASEQRAWANLVSPADYARILERCRNADQQICIVLGFRCGLRLGEILGLTAHDFFFDDHIFELTIVRNEHRDLKTPTSRRILPLNKLLEQSELELIERHVVERLAALRVAPGRNLLIDREAAAVGHTSKHPSAKKALDLIVREATSVSLIHHHLRHSFASYFLATMLLPDDCPDTLVPEQLRNVISLRRKVDLADTLLGKQKLGQHSLHSVSATLGHIVPDTTLRWYSHLLDLTLMQHVSRPLVEPALARDQVRILTARTYDPRPKPVADDELPRETVQRTRSYTVPAAAGAPLDGPTDLVKVSHWRGQRINQRERRFVAEKRKQAEPSPLQAKVSPRLKYPDWRHITAILSQPPTVGGQPFGTLWDPWSEAAARILALRRRSGKPRHQLDIGALLKSKKWAAYVDTRWRRDRRLTSIERRALFHAIETWDGRRSQVRFQSRPLAVAWRNLLLSLGFNRAELEISLRGLRFRARPTGELHRLLASAHDLPGTAAMRGRRGSIGISFKGDGKSDRQVRSAGHFVMLLLAIRESYGAPVPHARELAD